MKDAKLQLVRRFRAAPDKGWTKGPPEYPPDGVTSRITYEFVADGAGTRMTFTQERLRDQEEANSHKQGWSQALDKLDALLGEAK